MKTNKNILLKAKEFYKKAQEEHKRAKQEKDDILFRDSAEKGWNAVVLSTNYLIEKELNKKVRSSRERRENLDKIEEKNGNLKRYEFYDRFMARMNFLHIHCFYDGYYTIGELEKNLQKVKTYIRDIEKIVK